MEKQFELLKIGRRHIINLMEKLSEEELLEIPEGFNNNVLWNAGHMVTSQQRICYGIAGLKLNIPDDYVQFYGRDTTPRNWTKTPDIAELKKILSDTDTIVRDYQNGLFKNYKSYDTSYGFKISSIEDGIVFNNIHEALHFGVARTLSRLVKKTISSGF